ncbi:MULTISPECIES: DUF1453 family protein [Bacillus]|uniref:DUF1453 domain-containing protein n=1 Tax=Bacillus fungorum TaxID=2039284 RepID=A0A2G6QDE3_9BACI|nr:DUF1453 family protein [Bacillus fungorum]EKS7849407.1 DUF1453 family protein [Bacillus wiedmannii]EOQ30699.1 hypothetical protein KQ1_02548 [Bacillus cereus BAG3O-1]MBJ8116179.1 DUF1453 family protein [Bacillus cereus]RFB23849.1 DUF1453 family protein [Bacillus sp. LB(2018)]RFB75328.1 DUF1453 family protein [Bacillus sp. AW]HDR8172080.1 DUF1453 family protein [Bacillus thuringiensis]
MDILLVMLIIVLMQSKERKVKVNRIWLVPALLCFVTIQSIIHMGQLTILQLLLFVAMFGIGLVLGVIRGKALTFRIDNETGHVLRKGNWLSTMILLVILGAKILIKQSMFSGSTHYTLMLVTNAFLCITLGTVISRRYYIWKKYNELTQKV